MIYEEVIKRELEWLERVVKIRLEFPKVDIFNKEALMNSVMKAGTLLMRKEEYDINIPTYENSISCGFIQATNGKSYEERLMLILALCNHIESGFISKIVERGNYSELIKAPGFAALSGYVGYGSYGYYPTGRFWLYLIVGTNNGLKIEWMRKILNGEINVLSSGIVSISNTEEYEPFLGGMFQINPKNLLEFFS